ncbi:LacI family DNA-binding transcriptional regulator [Brachyspira pilosicoli]|uniref:LacI family DNA-binding transcriptional regulator n=1 Tax=Brachyspira pilosicoli TaxID=52584 RepID=UPI001C684DB4|nr:LacI family DNA-binding transcriptional regulator [Brachyspira pilosicoli]MBW5397278.1 LacI family transcriptional regulator [Brachyspira pilosicoli]
MKIRELSRISGISVATISKMLKNPNSVKESTRNKVNDVLKNKGMDKYFNINCVKRIVLIIPDLRNTFYLDLFSGIIHVVQKNNITFEIYLTNELIEEEIKIFSRLENESNIGIIWVPASAKRDRPPYTSNNNNIISLVDRNLEFESIYIKNLPDNFSAAKKATDLLIEGGAKNPIIVTGNSNLSNAQERRDGFLQSIEDHGLDITVDRVYYGDFNNTESSYKIIKDIIENKKIKFDSVLVANQILAIGILRAFREKNISIPKDVSMMTFDKLENLYSENMNISEVVFPAFDIGANATSILIDRKPINMSKQIYNYSAQFHLRGSEKK